MTTIEIIAGLVAGVLFGFGLALSVVAGLSKSSNDSGDSTSELMNYSHDGIDISELTTDLSKKDLARWSSKF